jgi:DNA-binding response OmpR family regulator
MTTAALILIVDGDRQSRTLISRVLKRVGYTIYLAETGEEALAAAKRERPALVILEVLLPGVSGFEVCRGVKTSAAKHCRSSSSRELARSPAIGWPASSSAATTTS